MMIVLIGFNANAAMYIVGPDPFGDWEPDDGVQMTPGDGVYKTGAFNYEITFYPYNNDEDKIAVEIFEVF